MPPGTSVLDVDGTDFARSRISTFKPRYRCAYLVKNFQGYLVRGIASQQVGCSQDPGPLLSRLMHMMSTEDESRRSTHEGMSPEDVHTHTPLFLARRRTLKMIIVPYVRCAWVLAHMLLWHDLYSRRSRLQVCRAHIAKRWMGTSCRSFKCKLESVKGLGPSGEACEGLS